MKGMISYINRMVAAFAVTVVAISCTGHDIDLPSDALVDYPIRLSACYPAIDTRIAVDGTSVSWNKDNDMIKVVAVAADNETTGTSELKVFGISDNGKTASFTGYVSMTAMPDYCCFMYPVHNSMSLDPQTGMISVPYNNQSGYHEPFLYARTSYKDEVKTEFHHIGAMLEITCGIEDVKQLTFAGNGLESLSPIIVNSSTGEYSVSDEANLQITVPVREGKTYIAVPPVNLPKGFSIICSNKDGSKSMIKTFSSDGSLSSGYDFSQKKGHIIPVVLDGTLENFAVTASDPAVTHKTTNGLLTGTSVVFSMSKTGASNKLVEEWGATLVNSDGKIVREIKFTNSDPPKGQTVTMEVKNEWKLLPEGKYTFTPYYKIYGQNISLASQDIIVEDPGVKLEIGGMTSYDKYKAGDITGANTHSNTTIKGVTVTTNVDAALMGNTYKVLLDGTEISMKSSEISNGNVIRSYGDISKDEFRSYYMEASFSIGPWRIFDDEKFHITGLPLVVDFRMADPSSSNWNQGPKWSYLGIAGYSNTWVTFKAGNGGLITPKFHVPGNINIKTAIDAHTNCSDETDRDILISACPYDQESVITSSDKKYRPNYKATLANRLSSQGYGSAVSGIQMSLKNNALMYSNVNDGESRLYLNQTRVGIFQIMILYNN